MKLQKPFFLASNNEEAQKKKESLEKKFGTNAVENADVIVVLGGEADNRQIRSHVYGHDSDLAVLGTIIEI